MAMRDKIYRYVQRCRALKFTMSINVKFVKTDDSSIKTDPPVWFTTQPFPVYKGSDINDLLSCTQKQLLNRIDTFESNGSGWILNKLIFLDVNVWELDPLHASSYHPVPSWITNKRAVVNVKNKEQECFKWAVLAGMHNSQSPKQDIFLYRIRRSIRLVSTQIPCFAQKYNQIRGSEQHHRKRIWGYRKEWS